MSIYESAKFSQLIAGSSVPLATLVSATKAPTKTSTTTILSPKGLKRYFVVHGGLFSKDGVTLDDVRKIPRIGRQPGQDGLMCAYPPTLPTVMTDTLSADVCIYAVLMLTGTYFHFSFSGLTLKHFLVAAQANVYVSVSCPIAARLTTSLPGCRHCFRS